MESLNEFKHFIERAKERYNLDLTLQDLQYLAEEIKSGRAKLIKADSRGFQYKVRFKSTLLIVVLNRSQSAFITTIPMKKNKEKVKFEGRYFSYEDSLFINWMFRKTFNTPWNTKVSCPKCGNMPISVDLGKDRFKCPYCNHIVKYKKIQEPVFFIQQATKTGFKLALSLSTDLWWYLYKNDLGYDYEDIKIVPILVDNDRQEYIIQYSNKEIVLPKGCYTVEYIKEKVNGN